MSADSGGSTSSTEPCDVPKMTSAVQEAQHEVAKSCSELTVEPSKSLSLLRPLSTSASVRVTVSLPPGFTMQSTLVTSMPYVKEDEEEHQNEDATQYSHQSSESSGGSSQDTLKDQVQDAQTSHSSEDDELTTPIPVEKIDSDEGQMVVTEYTTPSLSSIYWLIRKREEINPTPNDTDETTSLFLMDDDEPPPHDDQARVSHNADSGSSEFTSRFLLRLAQEESINCIPNPPPPACQTAESGSSCANGESKVTVEDESHAPAAALQPATDAVRNPVVIIDKADEHRGSNNYMVANTGEIIQGIQRRKFCSLISNSSQVDYNLRKFDIDGAKVVCTLHPQGKGQDYTDRNVSVTNVLHLPKYARNPDSVYAQPNCAISLSVEAYKGSVEKRNLLGKASKIQKVCEEERQNLIMHVDVYNVASQVDIIYSRSSEMIYIRIVAELLYEQLPAV